MSPLAKQGGLIVFYFLFFPHPAWALQTHAGHEGLYVHQLAHIFCALAVLKVAFEVSAARKNFGMSWRFFSIGAAIFATWNIWAFFGHMTEHFMSSDYFNAQGSGRASEMEVNDILSISYYVLHFDHFIAVPAMLFFYLGMRYLAVTDSPAR